MSAHPDHGGIYYGGESLRQFVRDTDTTSELVELSKNPDGISLTKFC